MSLESRFKRNSFKSQSNSNQSGFALFMVLSLIIVVSTFMYLIRLNVLNYRKLSSSEIALATNQSLVVNLSNLFADLPLEVSIPGQELLLNGKRCFVFAVPSSGFIDVNTADVELIERWLEAIGVESTTRDGVLSAVSEHRRNFISFRSVSDFARGVAFPPEFYDELIHDATVYSGKTGISLSALNEDLLLLLFGNDRLDADKIQSQLLSEDSFENLHVFLKNDKGTSRLIAVVKQQSQFGRSQIIHLERHDILSDCSA